MAASRRLSPGTRPQTSSGLFLLKIIGRRLGWRVGGVAEEVGGAVALPGSDQVWPFDGASS